MKPQSDIHSILTLILYSRKGEMVSPANTRFFYQYIYRTSHALLDRSEKDVFVGGIGSETDSNALPSHCRKRSVGGGIADLTDDPAKTVDVGVAFQKQSEILSFHI